MECELNRLVGDGAQVGMVQMRDAVVGAQAHVLEPLWLIDPTRYASVAECATAFGVNAPTFDRLANLYHHYAPALREWGPRLLPAKDGPVDLALQQAFERLSASLLVTPHATDAVARHLTRLLKLRQPDGTRLLFRFQDPLVMAHLLPLLAREQQSALLGPIHSWWVADECGAVVSVHQNGLASATRQLALTPHQMETLDTRLLPATVITQVNEVETTLLANRDRCAKWRDVRARLQRARTHGLAAPQDLSLFVILSLQLPDDFDQVGPVARALGRAKAAGIGFSKAIEQVPVEEWREWDEVLDER